LNFGKSIKEAREQMNLSQEEAAVKIRNEYRVRLSPSYLSMIENGQKTNLTTNLEKALCSFFNVPHPTSEKFVYTPPSDTKPLENFIREFSGMDADEQKKTIQSLFDILLEDKKKKK
jgi:transcriptional regulator with XRE-family HTH domain